MCASVILPGIPATIFCCSFWRFSALIASKCAFARLVAEASYVFAAPGRLRMKSSKAAKSLASNASAFEPSNHSYSRSVRVQSMTGMKL